MRTKKTCTPYFSLLLSNGWCSFFLSFLSPGNPEVLKWNRLYSLSHWDSLCNGYVSLYLATACTTAARWRGPKHPGQSEQAIEKVPYPPERNWIGIIEEMRHLFEYPSLRKMWRRQVLLHPLRSVAFQDLIFGICSPYYFQRMMSKDLVPARVILCV